MLFSPGYAVDGLAPEICMSKTMECPLYQVGERLYVFLAYVEADPVLMPGDGTRPRKDCVRRARIEEAVGTALESTRPPRKSAIALLRPEGKRWTRASSFHPPRAKSFRVR